MRMSMSSFGPALILVTIVGAGISGAAPAPISLLVSTLPDPLDCSPVSVFASFLTPDTVHLSFRAPVTTADTLSSDWLTPDGTVIPGKLWNNTSGTACFVGPSLTIAANSSKAGTWQARL